jgi:uncharacterized protein (TIGR03083 family)
MMNAVDRMGAAWRERDEVLRLCRQLDDDEWGRPSAADGWTVRDVIAHMGSVCHAFFAPAAMVKILRSRHIERTNDDLVDDRRTHTAEQILAEYERWTAVVLRMFGPVSRTPLARLRVPLAELGRFPTAQMVGALVFDTHTHLRHDIAPVLGRPVPASDANRLAVVADWMMAVLSNSLRSGGMTWRDRPVAITLTGPGGGMWTLKSDGTLTPGRDSRSAAEITGTTDEFPEWGTKRVGWRDRDIAIGGDYDYGVRFLDEMNIV